MTPDEIAEMRERATDGDDHEWGWYQDDVPALLAAWEADHTALEEAVKHIEALTEPMSLAVIAADPHYNRILAARAWLSTYRSTEGPQ